LHQDNFRYMKIDKLVNAIKNKKTILGVGPMSENCIHATIEMSQLRNIPIQFIPSRRQIDSSFAGSGYVNKWSTEVFSEHIKNNDLKQNLFLARDHGGPWQNSYEKEEITEYKDALNSAMESFKIDILSGFDFLHIDTSIDLNQDISSEEAAHRACEILYLCEDFARSENKILNYEIGTELQGEGVNDINEVKNNLNIINSFCDKNKIKIPFFYVIQNGAKVLEMENVGIFESNTSEDFTEEFNKIKRINKLCNDFGIFSKAHNSDYLSKIYASLYPELGINGANIAPEFGVIETKTYIEILDEYNLNTEKEDFLKIAYESKKWEKWLKPNSLVSDYEKSLISGHYIFSNDEFQEIKNKIVRKVSSNFDLDEKVRDNIKNKIIYYLESFGWNG
jgi:hypothetical protein